MSLKDRIRVKELPYRGTFGVKFHAKIEGVVVAMTRTRDDAMTHALERLQAAGVTAETPTWEIANMLKKHEEAP